MSSIPELLSRLDYEHNTPVLFAANKPIMDIMKHLTLPHKTIKASVNICDLPSDRIIYRMRYRFNIGLYFNANTNSSNNWYNTRFRVYTRINSADYDDHLEYGSHILHHKYLSMMHLAQKLLIALANYHTHNILGK